MATRGQNGGLIGGMCVQKITAPIAEITLNEATFNNETFQETLVNYLDGKDGGGK